MRIPAISQRPWTVNLLLLSTLIACAVHAEMGSRAPTSSEYAETDEAFGNDISRSQRARWALERLGERAPRGDFRFPDHVEAGSVYGIDVSRHQGQIDWPPIPQNSVVFAIAKATQGNTWSDPQFGAHWVQFAELRDEVMARGLPNFFPRCVSFFQRQDRPVDAS
jgi:GH25 family lysozyme M1 (1,4-beta-N-acetylmuramidase)